MRTIGYDDARSEQKEEGGGATLSYIENDNSSRNAIRGWAVKLLYPSMLLFTIINLSMSSFSRELVTLGASASSSLSASHQLDSSFSTPEKKREETAVFNQSDLSSSQIIETEAKNLLSHILVTIPYWHSPDEREVKFVGHTLGTIREWRLLPEIGHVTVVIITNDAAAAKASLGMTNNGWYTFHQVDTHEHPYHMPFYHREVIADYIDPNKDGSKNTTGLLNKDFPPPSSYAYFEADNVLNGAGLLAWARDMTLILGEEGKGTNHVRHFWRWEWNTLQGCAAFTGQVKPIPKNSTDRVITIGGKRFVSMTGGGAFAGMYVVTSQHMMEYYASGSFWKLPKKERYTREIQLFDIVHGSDVFGKPDKITGDNTIVPLDETTGTVDVISGVHHQSDKYQKGRYKLGKLCINDLFYHEFD